MNQGQKTGVTLIELLVGVSIFSVISVSLYMTFVNGVMFSRKAWERDDLIQDARWTIDALSEDLENMVPYSQGPIHGNIEPGRSFAGERDRVAFFIMAEPGLKQVQYFIVRLEKIHIHQVLVRQLKVNSAVETGSIPGDDHRVLLVREERPFPLIDEKDEDEETEQEILSFHVLEDTLRFSYAFWADDSREGDLSWTEQWDRQGVPAGVRFKATFAPFPKQGHSLEVKQDIWVPLGMKGLLPKKG